jgi:hypothetical protein
MTKECNISEINLFIYIFFILVMVQGFIEGSWERYELQIEISFVVMPMYYGN